MPVSRAVAVKSAHSNHLLTLPQLTGEPTTSSRYPSLSLFHTLWVTLSTLSMGTAASSTFDARSNAADATCCHREEGHGYFFSKCMSTYFLAIPDLHLIPQSTKIPRRGLGSRRRFRPSGVGKRLPKPPPTMNELAIVRDHEYYGSRQQP